MHRADAWGHVMHRAVTAGGTPCTVQTAGGTSCTVQLQLGARHAPCSYSWGHIMHRAATAEGMSCTVGLPRASISGSWRGLVLAWALAGSPEHHRLIGRHADPEC